MSSFEDVDETQEDESSIDFDLVWLLGQVQTYFAQGVQQQLEHTPISTDGLAFLATVIVLGDNATPSELAHWMMRKPNTISGLTKRLEEKGFVEKKKTTGANNRVYLRIALTEKGKQFLNRQWGSDIISAAFAELPLEEKRQFRKTLFRTRASIAQKVNGYEEPPFPSPETPSPYWKRWKEEQIG